MRGKLKFVLISILVSACFYYFSQDKENFKLFWSRGANDKAPVSQLPPRVLPAIDQLTRADYVAGYLHSFQSLPDFYLKKSQARQLGWQPSKGNLCDRLPGKAIGGDHFANRERKLPNKVGRQWFEADVNYRCGRRSTQRIVYSSDGFIFFTQDHYRHFRRLF